MNTRQRYWLRRMTPQTAVESRMSSVNVSNGCSGTMCSRVVDRLPSSSCGTLTPEDDHRKTMSRLSRRGAEFAGVLKWGAAQKLISLPVSTKRPFSKR